MPHSHQAILSDPTVRAALKQAWQDSNPGIRGGHEEGGFVAQDSAGNLNVIRWPQGLQNSIIVPPHRDCRIDEQDIVASLRL